MTKTRWVKIGWVASLVILFAAFSAWYGGNGEPLTKEQGAELIAQLRASYPGNESGLADNLEEMIVRDDGKEFYAVNLEQLKVGDEARAADRAYAGVVFPLLIRRAGHPVFVSDREGLMLGEYGSDVDRVAVVRYRSLRDLINMAKDPVMVAGGYHKFDALKHTEVFITRPTITFVHVRITLALLLILLGWVGLRLIDWMAERARKRRVQ
jgi:molybdopterin converting factor small subunit